MIFSPSNNNNNNNNNNYNSNEMSMTMVTNTNMNMVIPAVGREFIATDKNKNQEMLHQTCVMLLMCSLANSNSLVETKFNQFLMLEILAEMPKEQRRKENLWTKLVKTKGFCDFLRRQKNECESLVFTER